MISQEQIISKIQEENSKREPDITNESDKVDDKLNIVGGKEHRRQPHIPSLPALCRECGNEGQLL